VNRAFIRVFKTMSLLCGTAGPEQSPIQMPERVLFTNGVQPMGQSAEVFSGLKKVNLPAAYDRDGTLVISQPDPLPFTLVAVVMEGDEFD
jgi:hypothetical protein